MSDILDKAITSVTLSKQAFFHFIVANEVGSNGSHQCGFYIQKGVAPYLFDTVPQRGSNAKLNLRIRWQDTFETDSVLTYYGVGTRNEYRITCFGRNFPFLRDEYIGSMVVFARLSKTFFEAFILKTEDDIENFLIQLRLSSTDCDKFISSRQDSDLNTAIEKVLGSTDTFLGTDEMGSMARSAWNAANMGISSLAQPDKVLTGWYNCEELLFKILEDRVYHIQLTTPFYTCEAAASFANMMLNRRKARAGKSLEHHLAAMFRLHRLKFEEQVRTEGNKRPDFIFPDGASYHDILFPTEKLVFLGAKTTCKDRWRQVLNEADRIRDKYLFTLQQGVSSAQMDEMRAEHLHLVVPKMNIQMFPKEQRTSLISLADFINLVKETQN